MKSKIFLTALLLLISMISVNAQTSFFDKLSDRDDVSTVYISKALLSMMPDLSSDMTGGANIKGIANKLEQLEVYSSENKEVGDFIKKEINTLVKNKKYENLMTIKDKGENVVFYARKENNVFKDLIMFVDEPKEYTIIRIIGNFTAEDIKNVMNK